MIIGEIKASKNMVFTLQVLNLLYAQSHSIYEKEPPVDLRPGSPIIFHYL